MTRRSRTFCLWRNWRWTPTFSGRSYFLYFVPLPPSHYLLQLLFKLSVYVKDWAANCSIDLLQAGICRAGFSSVSTATLHIVHWKKGQRRVQLVLSFHGQTCPHQVTNKFTIFFPWRFYARAVFWHVKRKVTASHSVTVSFANNPPSYREAVWTPMLCRLRSVCTVVPGVSLLASRPWWVAVVTHYWYPY